jgi:hypothetical protein
MFKVHFYIFIKIQADVTTYKLISSKLNIGFILFLSQWQPKHIVNFRIFHNIIKIYLMFNVKIRMNTILTC